MTLDPDPGQGTHGPDPCRSYPRQTSRQGGLRSDDPVARHRFGRDGVRRPGAPSRHVAAHVPRASYVRPSGTVPVRDPSSSPRTPVDVRQLEDPRSTVEGSGPLSFRQGSRHLGFRWSGSTYLDVPGTFGLGWDQSPFVSVSRVTPDDREEECRRDRVGGHWSTVRVPGGQGRRTRTTTGRSGVPDTGHGVEGTDPPLSGFHGPPSIRTELESPPETRSHRPHSYPPCRVSPRPPSVCRPPCTSGAPEQDPPVSYTGVATPASTSM